MGLQVINKKQTGQGGLWWHPEMGCFTSQAISLAQLREFTGSVRLYVKKNPGYNSGKNGRPNYVFWLKDAASDSPKELSVEDVVDDDDEDDRRYTYADLLACVRGACQDGNVGYDPYDCIPEDYIN